MKALLLGQSLELMEAMPAFLARAGYVVDVISTCGRLARSRHVARFSRAESPDQLVEWAGRQVTVDTYDLTVACDDSTLRRIRQSSLPTRTKLLLLPVTGAEHFDHLHSKIGLSRALRRHGLLTPDFLVAQGPEDLTMSIERLGLQAFVKLDASAGGVGVYKAAAVMQSPALQAQLRYPVLVQQGVQGRTIDLSGFFRQGRPVYFGHSEFISTASGPFGPSAVRNYTPLAGVDAKVQQELTAVGQALGLHGFANITCIESDADGRRYFIEADARPNTWVEHQRYFEDDPAARISQYLQSGRMIELSELATGFTGAPVILAHLPRMRALDVLLNRFDCRRHYPNYLRRHILLERVDQRMRRLVARALRPWLPDPAWGALKALVGGAV